MWVEHIHAETTQIRLHHVCAGKREKSKDWQLLVMCHGVCAKEIKSRCLYLHWFCRNIRRGKSDGRRSC